MERNKGVAAHLRPFFILVDVQTVPPIHSGSWLQKVVVVKMLPLV